MEKAINNKSNDDNKNNKNTIIKKYSINDKIEKKKISYSQQLEIQRTSETLNKCSTLSKPNDEKELQILIQKIKNFKSSYYKGQFCKYFLRGCCINKPKDCQFAHSVKELNIDNYRRLLEDYEHIKHSCELTDNLQRGWAFKNEYNSLYDYMLNNTKFRYSKYQINNNLSGKRHVIRQLMLIELFNEFYDILLEKVINIDVKEENKIDYIPIKDLNELYLKAVASGIRIKYDQSPYFFIKDIIINDKKVSAIRRIPSLEIMNKYYKNLLIQKIEEYVDLNIKAGQEEKLPNEIINNDEAQEKTLSSPNKCNTNIKTNNAKKEKMEKKDKKIKEEKLIPLNLIFPITSQFIRRVLVTQTASNYPDIISSYFKQKNITCLEYLQELKQDSDFVEKIITIAEKAGIKLNNNNIALIPNNLELFMTTFNEMNSEFNKNNKNAFFVDLNNIVYNSKLKIFISTNIGYSVKEFKFLIKSMYLCTNETKIEMKKKNIKDGSKTINTDVLQYTLFLNNNNKYFIFNLKKFSYLNNFSINELLSNEIFERCSNLSETIQQDLSLNEDNDDEESKTIYIKENDREDRVLNNIINKIDSQIELINKSKDIFNFDTDNNNIETYTLETKYQENFKITIINNYQSLKEFVLISPYIKTISIDLEGKLSLDCVDIELIQCYCSFKNDDSNKIIQSQVFIFDLYSIKSRKNSCSNSDYSKLNSELLYHIQLILTKVLENQYIVKIFHDCRGDINALHKELQICVSNVIDISCLHIFNQQLEIHKVLKDNHYSELNQVSFEKVFQGKDKILDSMFSEFYNDMYCSTLPSLNKILEKCLNKTNYLKEKIGAMFGDTKQRNFFLTRPIEKDWLNYSALDVVYLEDSVKVLEENILDTLKNLGYANFKKIEDIRILSMLLSNNHAKCSCEKEEEYKEDKTEDKEESTFSHKVYIENNN